MGASTLRKGAVTMVKCNSRKETRSEGVTSDKTGIVINMERGKDS